MVSSRKKYIQLGQGILPHEQMLLEQSIQAALLPMLPTDRFVVELEHDLIQEARRQARYAQNVGQGWRIAGWVSGGLLSIAGGILVWTLLRQRQTQKDGGEAVATSKRRPFSRMPKYAGVTPAVSG